MANLTDISERFLDVLRGGRAKSKIDDTEYGEFLMRAIRAWEARVLENPEMLAQNELMRQRFAEIACVVIASNAERYAIDPRSAMSMLECARVLGMSKAGTSERRAKGVAIMAERIDQAGAVRFSEARREREALAAAHQHAVTNLADYRARHAA